MRRRARDAHAAEVVDNVEQPFQDEALVPAPRRRGRGSSGRGVVLGCIYLIVIFIMDLLARLYVTLISGDV